MKILYLLNQDPDQTMTTFMEVQKDAHEVHAVKLGNQINFDQLVDQIVAADRVISW